MIRQGFVSNSSSSSFVIKYMDDMKFEDIPNKYNFNEKVPAEVRAWIQIIIWELYKSKAQIDEEGKIEGIYGKDSYLYPHETEFGEIFTISGFLKELLGRENEARCREFCSYMRSEEWYEKAREVIRTNKDAWWVIGLGSCWSDEVGSIRIPEDIIDSLELYCEDIFDEPSTGLAIYGH